MKHFPAIAILATTISACGATPRNPTAPAEPAVTYTLSGIVVEMTPAGLAGVEGVTVEEGTSGLAATTDRDGFFSMAGVRARAAVVSARKAGYEVYSGTLQVTGDTRLDIQIARVMTYTLSGVTYELTAAGQAPLEGVEVYCDGCGSPVGHTFAVTDRNGVYSFSWALNGPTPLMVRKDGYRVVNGAAPHPDIVVAPVKGDTRFDIELARR